MCYVLLKLTSMIFYALLKLTIEMVIFSKTGISTKTYLLHNICIHRSRSLGARWVNNFDKAKSEILAMFRN